MSAKLDAPFQCLFDESTTSGLSLPPDLQETYDGDWVLPVADDHPYTYSNFVVSHDGRISFNEPGHFGGGDVSGFNAHDTWLMALLRARADAIMVGDNTLRLEPSHVWSHQYIFPDAAETFSALREAERRSHYPLQVLLSIDGNINWDAHLFTEKELHVVIATTRKGAEMIAANRKSAGKLDVISQDNPVVDIGALRDTLHGQFGVNSLLIEGGPRAYGSAIADKVIDEEFLTLSPIVVGSDRANDKHRPGLLEGVAFEPDNPARMVPLSLRRHGAYLFVRSKCVYPAG